MAQLRIERVVSLPNPLTASTMYIVRASDAALTEIVMTGNDGTEVRHILNKQDVSTMIADAVGSLTNIVVVQDIAARDALEPTATTIALVLDATGDVTVNAGAALYLYDPAQTLWIKVAEYESLDLSLNWDNIVDGPTSSPAQIDAAVGNSHTHSNKSVLDALGDSEGALTYNGEIISAQIASAEW